MEPEDIAQSFRILRKCQNKFDCLIFEMFFIQELKPTLNKQCDGRTVGRSVYGHVTTKFSRMSSLTYFLTHGAPLRPLRVREHRYE